MTTSTRRMGRSWPPRAVLQALRQGNEPLALQLALRVGERDENRLTSLLFNHRHPERKGRKLGKDERGYSSLAKEWLQIRDAFVRPLLSGKITAAGAASPDCDILERFVFDSAKLTSAHRATLQALALRIVASQGSSSPIKRVRIVGHTDPRGSEGYNLDLGQRRAEAAMLGLVTALNGVKLGSSSSVTLTTESRGEAHPVPKDAARSRRVELCPITVKRPPPLKPQRQIYPPCSFFPSKHGFRFDNSFSVIEALIPLSLNTAISKCLNLQPIGLSVMEGLMRRAFSWLIDQVKSTAADITYGLCGGMVFMAMDHFWFGLKMPTRTSLPANFSPLHCALIKRQIEAWDVLNPKGSLWRFIEWMRMPDRGSGSVASHTAFQFRLLQSAMRRGEPAVLGLVQVKAEDEWSRILKNHIVLARCLTQRSKSRYTIHIYDPNYHSCDDMTLEVELKGGEARVTKRAPALCPTANGGSSRQIRGFFVMPYEPVDPR